MLDKYKYYHGDRNNQQKSTQNDYQPPRKELKHSLKQGIKYVSAGHLRYQIWQYW